MFDTYRADYRGSVILALGPALAPEARWTTSVIPTLANAETLLQGVATAQCQHSRLALRNNSDNSPLDTTHGHYGPVMAVLARETPTSLAAMSQAFTDMIIPLGTAKGTRLKAWRNWRTVLTWGAGRHSLGLILPMSHPPGQCLVAPARARRMPKATCSVPPPQSLGSICLTRIGGA